jgi:hypothetical protein
MMDFTNPSREPRYTPRPTHPRPAAVIPPPAPRPEPAREEPAPRKRRLKRAQPGKKWLKTVLIAIILVGVAWLAHGYINTRNQLEQLSTGGTAGQSPTQQLVSKVGKLVDLPTGETPTIATVNNASKLKSQAFFASAQNGDKVIIYTKAGKGVLYRPSTNKIIEYSTVNLGSTSQ